MRAHTKETEMGEKAIDFEMIRHLAEIQAGIVRCWNGRADLGLVLSYARAVFHLKDADYFTPGLLGSAAGLAATFDDVGLASVHRLAEWQAAIVAEWK